MTPQGQAFISLWQQMYVVPSCKCYANRKKRKKKESKKVYFLNNSKSTYKYLNTVCLPIKEWRHNSEGSVVGVVC